MKFKCKISGEVVEFEAEHDVLAMQTHPGYEVVEESTREVEKPKAAKKESGLKTFFKD